MSVQALAWVFDFSPTSKDARLVLLSLANHAGKNPSTDAWEAWPGLAVIAKEAGVGSERTVQRVLSRLQAMGAIDVIVHGAPDMRVRPDRRPNLYRILLSHGVTPVVTPSSTTDSGDDTTTDVTPSGRQELSPRDVHGVTKTGHGVTKTAPRGDNQVSCEPSTNQQQPNYLAPAAPGLPTSGGSVMKRAKPQPLPEPFIVSDSMRSWAALETPSVRPDDQVDQFSDFHRARGKASCDWDASFRTWLRNAELWGAKERNGKRSAGDATAAAALEWLGRSNGE